jgi:ankyrin repeat protein
MSNGGETRIKIMQKIFPWIACARRPLTIEEINEAYAIDVSDNHLDRDKIPTNHNKILEACGSLILFDKDDRTVTFAHRTVKQFLVGSTSKAGVISTLQFTLDEAEFSVGEACVTYLCFSDFETQVIRRQPTAVPIQSNLIKGTVNQIPFSKSLYSIGSRMSGLLRFDNRDTPKPFLLPLPKHGPPSGDLEERYRLLNYIFENWPWHTSQFAPNRSPLTWARFKTLTFERQLNFDIRPWTSPDGEATSTEHSLPHLELFQWATVDQDLAAFLRLWDQSSGTTSLKAYLDCEVRAARNPFIEAVRNGYYTLVQLLLVRGQIEVDAMDCNGRTPLLLAAENGQEVVVKLLLATDQVEVNVKDGDSRSPLSWAAGNGHEAVVKLLLATDQVKVVSQDIYGRTPLSWAVGNGHEAVVKLLLARGQVMVDFQDRDGRTPLSWAVGNGHEAVVKLLLARGRVMVDFQDRDGRTPLSWAAGNGHEAAVKLLLMTGRATVNMKDNHSRTPLSWATGNGHEAVVNLLLATGEVDVYLEDRYGRTPLSWAAINGHEAVVKLLLATGQVTVGAKFKDEWRLREEDAEYEEYAEYKKENRTPLLLAAMNGHEAVVKLLLATGPAMGWITDNCGRSPLSWAARNGHETVVQLLLVRGQVEVDAMDCNCQTPLSLAAKNGHEAVVKLLLAKGQVNVDSKDINGRTPLSWAAGNGREAVVKLLLETDQVEVNVEDRGGRSPQSWAAENRHETVVKLLQLNTR